MDTGACSGIGRALAESFAERKASLVLSARNVQALEEVARHCACPTLVLPCEAANFEGLASIVHRASYWAETLGGPIYGLVNNAGVSQRSLALETVFDVYQRIVAVDLLAPIALAQALLPGMARAGAGYIVAISSIAGIKRHRCAAPIAGEAWSHWLS